MSADDARDGLARAIHAADQSRGLASADWDDLLAEVRERYGFYADAALAHLAARPAVDVEAVARVLRAHRCTTTSPLPGVTYYNYCTCRWVDLTGPDHARHQAEQIAALLPTAPEAVTTAADAWDEGYMAASDVEQGNVDAAANPYRPTVDGAR